jgi:malic enzyme
VAVAGIVAASRAAGRRLADERLVVAGAGAAGVGIARLFRSALRREGVEGEALRSRVAMLDSKGLVVDAPDEYRKDLAWTGDLAAAHGLRPGSPLVDVVRAARPTVLLGVSGVSGLFGEEVVRAMAAHVERPAVFPLSNPTSKSEARPADVMAWTDGRALVATGSPFEPVEVAGRTVRIGQGNNVFVFPGVGLGVLVSEAREVTDGMFAAAADALAAQLPEEDLRAGSLFPRIAGLRGITAKVAEAVVRQAVDEGVARNPPEDPAEAVAAAMWDQVYPAIDVV